MLDPDEVAVYEQWKADKLTGAMDLSIDAFNREMTALAVAYDRGIDAMSHSRESAAALKASSPYRVPGMTGHNPARTIPFTTEGAPTE